jgi:catechol 2,3-dioxygenase-like lactoylglutathione lyase family enzyme
MDRLPLLRVAEVAILTPNLRECVTFYSQLGLNYRVDLDATKIHFAEVGEQLFGFADEKRGFIDGYGGYVHVPLHIAFEVPHDQLNQCIAFLNSKGIQTSPKVENTEGWHGAKRLTSVYFQDPARNVMELWAPKRNSNGSHASS